MTTKLAPVVLAMVVAAGCGKTHNNGAVDGGGGSDIDAPVVIDADLTPDADLCTGGSLCGTPAMCCPAGNECVLDNCVPTCATNIYCGADSLTCCTAGQVCLENACADPGAMCNDSYDCDPGNFCEPTLGRCLPQPNPLTCVRPTFDAIEPVLEWSNQVDQIISIPVVANLDGVGPPEVVVNITDNADFVKGRIEILNGKTGDVLVGPINGNPPTSYASHGRSTIAVGDVSGDGKPDIIYAAYPNTPVSADLSLIVAIDGNGNKLWTSHDAMGNPYPIKVENGGATLANFDDDPEAEIVFGATLIDNDGTVIWDAGAPGNKGGGGWFGSNDAETTYKGGISAVADLDGDGKPEIISGKNAWKVAWNTTTPSSTVVTPYWTYAGNDGYPAVADLDKDGKPEVILVAKAQVIVLNGQDGTLWCAKATCTTPADHVQPFNIPGGSSTNRGGPPTVADFDGDGRPEIGVAGGFSYSVYDIDRPAEDTTVAVGTPVAGQIFVRWTKATQDKSSNATGSSVFDFQGDGAAEVIYQDECNVWVYSGVDGSTYLKMPNTTGTIHEYPLVVDIDGDGNSEFVTIANDIGAGANCPGQTSNRGIYVYGDLHDRWVPTRKVWTQHAYHITNAQSDGNVPMAELDNWTQPGLNDYRKNAQGDGVFNAPNLTVELAVGLDDCGANMLQLHARVTNKGDLGVPPPVAVEFRTPDANGTVLGSGMVTTPLLPGGGAIVTLEVPTSAGTAFWAGVDGAPALGAVTECDETDNTDTVTDATCGIIFKR